MLCQTNGGAVKRESIVRKSKKDILRMLSPYLLLELRAPTPHRAFLPVAAGGFLTEFAKSVQQSCAILVLFLMKSTPLRQLRYLRYLWHALSSLCKENMSSPAPTGEKARCSVGLLCFSRSDKLENQDLCMDFPNLRRTAERSTHKQAFFCPGI
ncbi:hypothetical protein GCWU000341_00028 [Oribacterium sp. oral taxon 078 str. F0262]|nr:hypothetical protein GCWU000341_00028 [Oribacterium sp. oral taxon 078 str. F0262]